MEEGSVFILTVALGNSKKQFILDSGAGEVTISSELERSLIASGYIKGSDFLVSGLYQIADGSIILCKRVLLKNISVCGINVKNVAACVGGSSAPLLLGRSFLDKFRKWSIDNSTSTLYLEK